MAREQFSAAHFNDEDAARKHLERIRWPEGPVCPHCGSIGRAYARSRPGLYRCAEKECRKDFTATVGTLFERSHIPLTIWFKAVHLLCSSKKGMSAHQMHRTLGVTYKTAWFMCHRIREGMKAGKAALMGGLGKVVEADETCYGDKAVITKRTIRGKAAHSSKRSVVALVERGGHVRTFHVDRADKTTVTKIVAENIARESHLHTDESRLYGDALLHVAEHHTVVHSGSESTRTRPKACFRSSSAACAASTSTAANSTFTALAEFDFRYNNRAALGINDSMRTELAVKGIEGKRLTYGGPKVQ